MAKYGHILPAICCIALLGVPAAQADSFDGTYTGKRTLTKGDGHACRAEDVASATIKGDVLTFTNSNAKDYPVSFNPRPDGSFVELSANLGGAVVDIRGHIDTKTLDADVTSADCQHHWHLEKP